MRTYVISHPKGEEIVETFYEKELPKINQTELRVEKAIERKTICWMEKIW